MASDFKKLESTVGQLSKDLVKCNSELKHMKEAIDGEENKHRKIEANAEEVSIDFSSPFHLPLELHPNYN